MGLLEHAIRALPRAPDAVAEIRPVEGAGSEKIRFAQSTSFPLTIFAPDAVPNTSRSKVDRLRSIVMSLFGCRQAHSLGGRAQALISRP